MEAVKIFIKPEQQAQALRDMLAVHVRYTQGMVSGGVNNTFTGGYVAGVCEALECVVGYPAYAILEALEAKL